MNLEEAQDLYDRILREVPGGGRYLIVESMYPATTFTVRLIFRRDSDWDSFVKGLKEKSES